MRTNFDFSPYRRSTVGFDRLFDLIENSVRSESAENYPPYDVEKHGDDSYRITLGVAGFRPEDIEIVAQQNQLTVTGRRPEEKDSSKQYVYRGLAARAFERQFQLADFVQVHSAGFDNGLLTIDLKREIPEAMKPRKIEIGAGVQPQRIEDQQEEERKAA